VAVCSQALGHDVPSHRYFEELLDEASGPKFPGHGSHRIASGSPRAPACRRATGTSGSAIRRPLGGSLVMAGGRRRGVHVDLGGARDPGDTRRSHRALVGPALDQQTAVSAPCPGHISILALVSGAPDPHFRAAGIAAEAFEESLIAVLASARDGPTRCHITQPEVRDREPMR
jgi:hypothetical protein